NVAILESLGEGVVAIDPMMTVTYINKIAADFLGVEKEILLGKSFALSKQPQCHQLIHEAQSKGEVATAVLVTDKKPKRYLDAIAVPRGEAGAIMVLQDKTSLHKIIDLGRDLIANTSHELKTPITIIRGFAETLHDHPELSREVTQEITTMMVANCQRMDTLVKNLLALAAVEEGLPLARLQECDLVDLIEQAKLSIQAIHPTAKIEIAPKGEEPFVLMADSDLFLQAIINLLDNAVKYSKPPAEVTIILERGPHEITLHVRDKGVGMPAEALDHIFERFYAVDKTRSRSLGGSGLGLSIVERIVEKHQGKISVKSIQDEGTTFTLTFPI
nr:Alkaline phosphatase synthesis sensor protein PhoR [Chlamydiota bacterium]